MPSQNKRKEKKTVIWKLFFLTKENENNLKQNCKKNRKEKIKKVVLSSSKVT